MNWNTIGNPEVRSGSSNTSVHETDISTQVPLTAIGTGYVNWVHAFISLYLDDFLLFGARELLRCLINLLRVITYVPNVCRRSRRFTHFYSKITSLQDQRPRSLP